MPRLWRDTWWRCHSIRQAVDIDVDVDLRIVGDAPWWLGEFNIEVGVAIGDLQHLQLNAAQPQ
jgi:hypothetical protein